MVNKYLFLFNEKNNITNSFLIDNDYIIPSNYHDLLPYKISNNIIRFLISLNKNSDIIFLYYKITLETSKMEKINGFYPEKNVYNKLVRCLINNNKSQIYCFYIEQINNINYLKSFSEKITDNVLLSDEKYTNLTSSDKEINPLFFIK